MQKLFRPEFLNRVDEVIVFQHLKKAEILQIADLYLKRVNEQAASMNITIELSDALKDMLVDQGYDPNLGARPLKKSGSEIRRRPSLSEEMLLGRFSAAITSLPMWTKRRRSSSRRRKKTCPRRKRRLSRESKTRLAGRHLADLPKGKSASFICL